LTRRKLARHDSYLPDFFPAQAHPKTRAGQLRAAIRAQLPLWTCVQPLFWLLPSQLLSKFRFFGIKVGFFCYYAFYHEHVFTVTPGARETSTEAERRCIPDHVDLRNFVWINCDRRLRSVVSVAECENT
jgi:hypothetical protein